MIRRIRIRNENPLDLATVCRSVGSNASELLRCGCARRDRKYRGACAEHVGQPRTIAIDDGDYHRERGIEMQIQATVSRLLIAQGMSGGCRG